MAQRSFMTTLLSICFLLFAIPVHSWIATEYVAIIVSTASGGSQVYTATSSAVTVTGPVTPISTITSTPRAAADVNQPTLVIQYISGPNLPLAETPDPFDPSATTTSSSSSTISVTSAYFAEATITPNPTCPANVKFSYSACSPYYFSGMLCAINHANMFNSLSTRSGRSEHL
jgi:hypothetical protein